MLKLLLDEHISPSVARSLRRHSSGVVVHTILEWDQGVLLGQSDPLVLQAAARHKLTLVTYDRRTVPSLLKAWAEEGRSHAGVVFVDEKTIAPGNIGVLAQALTQLLRERGSWDWKNRVLFLRR